MNALTRYALIAVLCACLGLGAWAGWLQSRNADLGAKLTASRALLAGCVARQSDVSEQKVRVNEIDNLSDDDLRSRASEWLR
ncbi:MAG: hypothetical protein KJ731_15775 [Alphaproteobacteria bacterium]|uniref:Uncharacterized protein n=1 Tax=viral metagenome TaxID=1070528 RepID=A0A6M3JM68_9ZZZZ|nr:hypothetical protein [Alphaproteobacteria bacterium]MBU1277647.1 hypothetical protein [Alphaproteobacteria bacterium]MBU1574516.1 hypothetical protein [Alphaproteobacteria bacterium]MBU1829910.1 hypothetical protein [Alphaproteobacteria bacterium]MBU2079948.1 hypothetical protein [Alphaproteobacteria bacterium]